MSVRYTTWGHPGVVLLTMLVAAGVSFGVLTLVAWVAVYG